MLSTQNENSNTLHLPGSCQHTLPTHSIGQEGTNRPIFSWPITHLGILNLRVTTLSSHQVTHPPKSHLCSMAIRFLTTGVNNVKRVMRVNQKSVIW